jgi:hypothetical protein
MKSSVIFALLICQLAIAQTNFFPLLRCKDRTYTNATIESVTPATVSVFWEGGGERIPITNLPPELQVRYHYNPQEAQNYLDMQAAKKATRKERDNRDAAAEQQAVARVESQRKIAQGFQSFINEATNDVKGTITWTTKRNFMRMPDESPAELAAGVTQIAIGFTAVADIIKPIPESVSFDIIKFTRTGGRLYDDHDFTIAWDGSRTQVPHARATPDSGDLEEAGIWGFNVPMSFGDFKGIAFAKSVKAQFGDSRFELPYQNREAMRAFVGYFDRARAGSR